ncbi:hypothetical protein ACERK3_03625 [Phycisphaerales bacterium AB-hyl4]|uniref:PEP-CTERM protein-sorting domain-containing protein n=1 Tax=Natronomicrosphaera hydrolytica TaxID=3242702 RepID=A0ABV4U1G4_9BACT
MRFQHVLSSIIVVAGLVSTASASTIFYDGFESESVGSVGASFGNWVQTQGFPDQGAIVDSPVYSGDRALRIDDASGTQARGFYTNAFTEQVSGPLVFQAYIRPTATDQTIEITLGSADGASAYAIILLRDDGIVAYTSPSAWQNSSTVEYVANAWNQVELTADLDNNTWSLSVNGESVANDVAAGTPVAAGTSIGRVRMGGSVPAVTSFYVDDVSLVIPEPAAAFTLAAMGMTLLLRRRR